MPAPIDPAPFDAAAHADPGVGADEQPGRVDGAFGRGQGHRYRHLALGRVLGIRLHLRDGEVVGVEQALLQFEQLVLRVVVADIPGDETLHEVVAELTALEVRVGEPVAWSELPFEFDLCRVRGPFDLDAVGGELGVEVAHAEKRRMDGGLAALVGGMIESLALLRRKRRDGRTYGAQFPRLVADADGELADLDRLTALDVQDRTEILALVEQFAVDAGVVIAVRLQGLLDLALRAPVKTTHLGQADLARFVLLQLDRAERGCAQIAVDTVELDRHARRFRGRGAQRQEQPER